MGRRGLSAEPTSARTEERSVTAIARTTAGKIEGAEQDGLHVFRVAPCVAAPVGELRLKAPQPHPGWEGVRDATAFGSVSLQIQNGALDDLLGGDPQPQSED